MRLRLSSVYTFRCYNPDGSLVWVKKEHNLVTTEGLNDLLTKYFKGSAYTATWYVGLVDNASFTAFAAGDTAAKITTGTPSGATNSWKENTDYVGSVRPTLTLGTAAAGVINNTASVAAFEVVSGSTLKGAFLASSSTKGGTSGVLYGEAAFSIAQTLTAGQFLTVGVDLTAATA